jgi:quercetin dioxygenase-like cupin family protein
VIYRDETLNVTLSGFDAGQGLIEHTASWTALIEVLSGRLELTVDGARYDATRGFWLRMADGSQHALVAREPRSDVGAGEGGHPPTSVSSITVGARPI